MQLEAGRKYYYERTITHMLHWDHPRFLELEIKWVDELLGIEWDMKNFSGWCNLMYLFRSYGLYDFDFGCRRFRELLQRQRDRIDNYNWTVLMILCPYSP